MRRRYRDFLGVVALAMISTATVASANCFVPTACNCTFASTSTMLSGAPATPGQGFTSQGSNCGVNLKYDVIPVPCGGAIPESTC
jgi:hypothetical protein